MFENWFKKEEEKKCQHQIGNNTSKEVYIWKPNRGDIKEHYVLYRCELCNRYIKERLEN